MPHAALHYLLAGQVLEEWARAPARAPCEITPLTRNAFLHGALGPDMGYFPGADSLVSDLAHHARTSALARALIAEARSEVEVAFAWGWVTHLLADVAVHPLVNERCGELLLGRREPLWGRSVLPLHLRVELGLDAACCSRHPELLRVRLGPALGRHGVEFVVRAYRRTYGASPAAAALLEAHAQVVRLGGALGLLQRLWCAALAEGAARASPRAAVTSLRMLALLCPQGSPARGFTTPLSATPWLRHEVDEIVAGFACWFDSHYRSGLRFLRDHCLDTGVVTADHEPAASAALGRLARRAPLAA